MLNRILAVVAWSSLVSYASAAEPVAPAAPAPSAELFQVYVDQPTGFAFIRTPSKWLFVRKLTQAQVAAVPADQFVPPALRAAPAQQVARR